jgi:hypothetical protein
MQYSLRCGNITYPVAAVSIFGQKLVLLEFKYLNFTLFIQTTETSKLLQIIDLRRHNLFVLKSEIYMFITAVFAQHFFLFF